MAASANDKFMKTGTSTATTLSAPGFTSGGTSITVGSTTNWPTDTGVVFAIDVAEVVDGEQVRVAGTYTEYQGTVASGTSITNMTLTFGTAQSYAAGSLTRVYIPVSSEREERMVDGILAQHDQAGGHTSITVSGTSSTTGVATFASHIDVNDASTAIRDSSDNELVKFAKTASAVNEVTVTNNSTGNAPSISATGGDTNVGLNLVSKGTGEVQLNGTAISGAWTSWTPTLTNLSGGTITYAKYKQIGKTVFFRFRYTLGGAGVSGLPRFTLPVAANADYASADTFNHSGSLNDVTGNVHLPVLYLASSTAADIYYLGAAVNLAVISSTAPFTWAVNDRIQIHGAYEAA